MTYPDTDIQVTDYVSIHPLLQRHFATDKEVAAAVGAERVYAGEFPSDGEGVKFPAIKFRFPSASPLDVPALNWWTHVGQVDCYAEDEIEADELARTVIRSLMRLQQTTHPEGVVGTVSGWDVDSALDSEWTPPRPRRIVSVTLTARRN